jgi:hypothetical protein
LIFCKPEAKFWLSMLHSQLDQLDTITHYSISIKE